MYAGTKGYLDEIEKSKLEEFEEKLYDYLDASCPDLLESIRNSGELDEDTENSIKSNLDDFIKGF